ncbi:MULTISPECIES: hypothetical protein [unclassified Polaromonas]|jgi:hypothetical protein|uniref:hypothetical protein n=1 Tax=unclassified Polaromonas TaxID=2638319 RepID=UPI000BDDA933|nr:MULTISPECIES: hypothetical protein [unclassified Polaromonas]OYY32154.1 MAG: hypothetical protein B7Y60_23375 [Polaromonas sp. 35-63-35]OYZ15015.1 MAG: hypothetical protein B7Y28_22865 [Polaromonas sp. 16-63-31]OYZ75430.1 MAG: hypothetical protein B7Y09_24270 [Polaromonas sp. 24-63-21]OZA45718.1 MAG: hypothetical protein B7X88_24245 [Polaromonas sp. 17-63-33]OZA85101.1 MAG: hypothetical protein B7X65_22935 [Polaromonas sp. 39-63-25]
MERNTVATPIEDLKEHDLITNGHELGLLRVKSIEPPSGNSTLYKVEVVGLDATDLSKHITMTFYQGSTVQVQQGGAVTRLH